MQKKFLGLTLGMVVLLSGCAMPSATGVLYTDIVTPVVATANPLGEKVGTATCTSILNLIATGDCSTNAAAKQGNISKIFTVDTDKLSYLGIYSVYTTTVTGK